MDCGVSSNMKNSNSAAAADREPHARRARLEHPPPSCRAGQTDSAGPANSPKKRARSFCSNGISRRGLRQDAHGGIGIGGVPPGETSCCHTVGHWSPNQEMTSQNPRFLSSAREEFIAAQIFAAQNAVGVEKTPILTCSMPRSVRKLADFAFLLHGRATLHLCSGLVAARRTDSARSLHAPPEIQSNAFTKLGAGT